MVPIAVPILIAIVGQAAAQEPMRADQKGRPVVAVRVNDARVVDMVVDTAAQTSLLSPLLIEELGLKPIEGQTMTIRGVGGRTAGRLYGVDRIANTLFAMDDVAMLALPNAGVTTARGIIGMDVFATRKLVFDRAAGMLSVAPSGPAAPGFATTRGYLRGGTILTIPVTINGVAVDAIVDTGAQGSVASPALIAALGWKDDDARLRAYGTIGGASSRNTAARVATMESVSLGPVTFRQVPIVIADRAGVGGVGLAEGKPTIILGLDMLNLLQAFAVDLPRAEFQIRIPARGAG